MKGDYRKGQLYSFQKLYSQEMYDYYPQVYFFIPYAPSFMEEPHVVCQPYYSKKYIFSIYTRF